MAPGGRYAAAPCACPSDPLTPRGGDRRSTGRPCGRRVGSLHRLGRAVRRRPLRAEPPGQPGPVRGARKRDHRDGRAAQPEPGPPAGVAGEGRHRDGVREPDRLHQAARPDPEHPVRRQLPVGVVLPGQPLQLARHAAAGPARLERRGHLQRVHRDMGSVRGPLDPQRGDQGRHALQRRVPRRLGRPPLGRPLRPERPGLRLGGRHREVGPGDPQRRRPDRLHRRQQPPDPQDGPAAQREDVGELRQHRQRLQPAHGPR